MLIVNSKKNGIMYAKSVKNINKGEELYIHYGFNYWFRPVIKKNMSLSKLEDIWNKKNFINIMEQDYMNIIFDTN